VQPAGHRAFRGHAQDSVRCAARGAPTIVHESSFFVLNRVAVGARLGITGVTKAQHPPRDPRVGARRRRETAMPRPPAGGPTTSLQRDAVSLAGGIALAAAAMAPALAVLLNAPAAAPAAGGALPLAFLLAFLVCLLTGNTVIHFASHLPPSAGSFYAYNRE